MEEVEGGRQAIYDIKDELLFVLEAVERLGEPVILGMPQQTSHLLALRRRSSLLEQGFVEDGGEHRDSSIVVLFLEDLEGLLEYSELNWHGIASEKLAQDPELCVLDLTAIFVARAPH